MLIFENLLYIKRQIRSKNCLFYHLQCSFVIVNRESAQNLITLTTKSTLLFYITFCNINSYCNLLILLKELQMYVFRYQTETADFLMDAEELNHL